MNPSPNSESDAIRSDIEMTRRRMDDTMDALTQRLQGRHLIDELIGYFRGKNEGGEAGGQIRDQVSEAAERTKEKIADVAGTATRAVVNTIKENPVPVALIGAGVAWLAYSAWHKSRTGAEDEAPADEDVPYDPDLHYDRPIEYPGAEPGSLEPADEMTTSIDEMTGSPSAGETDTIKGKAAEAASRLKAKVDAVCDRVGELTGEAADRTREAYGRTRDRVVQTVDEHPLGVGLGCLAVGLLVGLALPTPKPVHRIAGPAVDRLRDRTRKTGQEFVQKGRRVVQAAAGAAKQEAEAQGLTWEQLRRGGRAVANQAEAAAAEAARQPGDTAQDSDRAGALPTDPSAGGKAM